MNKGLVSIILPTTGRALMAAESLRGIVRTTKGYPIQVCAVVDADPDTRALLLVEAANASSPDFMLEMDYSPDYRGNVQAWNDGLRAAHGEYIVFAADDLTFTDGWLDESLKVMSEFPDGWGLVGFNDGHWNGDELATHYIMHRRFIVEVLGGVVAWEWYKHSFNDLETNERAKRAGRFKWAEKAHVHHAHWTFGDRAKDATDERWLPQYDSARDMFTARQAAGFPNNYEPVIGPEREPKKRIGWLSDIPYQYRGGAEMVSEELQAVAPDWAEIIPCPAGQIDPNCDAYVMHNCFQYHADSIPVLEKKPVVKMLHDLWPHGDPELRTWLLKNSARLVFVSKLQIDNFSWFNGVLDRLNAPLSIVPSMVDTGPFTAAASTGRRRAGAVWVGRMFPGKGVSAAVKWAHDNNRSLDFYGYGPTQGEVREDELVHYHGPVEYKDLPEILRQYQTFVFLPDGIDCYSRTTIEAYAAGCELVVNGNVGALEWLNGPNPENVFRAGELFWNVVKEVIGGS